MSSFTLLNSINSSDQALENECSGIMSIPMEQTQSENSNINKTTIENRSSFEQNPIPEIKSKCLGNDLDQDIIIKEEFRCDRPSCIASQKKLRISRRWNRFYKQNLINIDKVLHLISELENEKRKNLDLQLAYDQRSREWSQQQEQLIQLLNEIQPLRERLRSAEESVVEEKKMRLKHQYAEESQKVTIQQLHAKVADLQTIAKPLFVENLGKKLSNCRSENKKIRSHLETSRGEIDQLRSYISNNHKQLEKLTKKYLRALEFGQKIMIVLINQSEKSLEYMNEGKVLQTELEETRKSLKFQYDHFKKLKEEKLKGRKLALSHVLSFSEWVRDFENVTNPEQSDNEEDSEAKSEEESVQEDQLLAKGGKKQREKQLSYANIASEANQLEKLLSVKDDVKECQSDGQSAIPKGSTKQQKGKKSSSTNIKKEVNRLEKLLSSKGDGKDSEKSLKKSPTKRGRMSQSRSPTKSPLSQTKVLRGPQTPVSARSLSSNHQTASIFDVPKSELTPLKLNGKDPDSSNQSNYLSSASHMKTPPNKRLNSSYITSPKETSTSVGVDSLSLLGDLLKKKELTPRQSSSKKRTKHSSSSGKRSTEHTHQEHSSTPFSSKVKSKLLIESPLSESSSSESDSELALKNKDLTSRQSSSRKRTKHQSSSRNRSTELTHQEHSPTRFSYKVKSKLLIESSLSESSSSESDSELALTNKDLTSRQSSSRKRTKHQSSSRKHSTELTHQEHSPTRFSSKVKSKLLIESSLSESSSSESDSVINKFPPSSPILDPPKVASSSASPRDQKMEVIEDTDDRLKIETILQVMSIDPIGISNPNLDDPKVGSDKQSGASLKGFKSKFQSTSQRKSLKANMKGKMTPERKMNTASLFVPTRVTRYSLRFQNLSDSGSSSQNKADDDVNPNPQRKKSFGIPNTDSDSTDEDPPVISKPCTSLNPSASTASTNSCNDFKQTLNSKLEIERTNKSPLKFLTPHHLLRSDLSISSSDSEMEVNEEKKVFTSPFTSQEELIEEASTNSAKILSPKPDSPKLRFNMPVLSLENSMPKGEKSECILFEVSGAPSSPATVQTSPKLENMSSGAEKISPKEENSNEIEMRSLNKRIKISNLFSDESASENSPQRDLVMSSDFNLSIRSISPSISSSSSEEGEMKNEEVEKVMEDDENDNRLSLCDSSQNSNDEASLVIDLVEPSSPHSEALPWKNIKGIHPFLPAKRHSTHLFYQETLPNLEPSIATSLSATQSSSLKGPGPSAHLPNSNHDQVLWKPSFYKEVKNDSLPNDCPQIIEGIFEEAPEKALLPEMTEETNVTQAVETKQSVPLVRFYVFQEEMETLEREETDLTNLEELFQNILGTRCQSSEWKTTINSIAIYMSNIKAPNTISRQQPIVKVVLLSILRTSPYEQCEHKFTVPPTMYKLFQIVRVIERFQKLQIFTLDTLINAAAHKLILTKSLRPNSLVTLMTWFIASCTAQYNHFSPPNDEDRVHWMRSFMIDLLYHHKGLIHEALLVALNTSRKIFLKTVRCRESTVVEKVIVWIVYFGEWTGLKSTRKKLSCAFESKLNIQKPPPDFIEKILTKILEDLTAVDVNADKVATTKLGFYLLLRWLQPFWLTKNFFPLFRKVYYDESCKRVELQTVKQLLEAMIRTVKWPQKEEESFLKLLSSFPLLK